MQNDKTPSVVLDLKRLELECPSCFTQFDLTEHLPITLPCSHDLCTSCLGKFAKENICYKCKTEFD